MIVIVVQSLLQGIVSEYRCKGTNYFGYFQIIRMIFGKIFSRGGENADG